MTVTVICKNTECTFHDQKRTVGRQHMGQHVYLLSPMVCDCGNVLVELEGE